MIWLQWQKQSMYEGTHVDIGMGTMDNEVLLTLSTAFTFLKKPSDSYS